MSDNWTPAAQPISPAYPSFFSTPAFLLPATIDLPHSPAQIWDVLTAERLGAWVSVVDRARWIDPAPRSPDARRTMRLLRCVTIEEAFPIWEERSRLGFRALALRPRVARAWAEQAELEPLAGGGTRLTYSVAIDTAVLRLVPRALTRLAAALWRRAVRGIVTVLPTPAPVETRAAQ